MGQLNSKLISTWYIPFQSIPYLLCEAQYGLLLVVGVGAEALDVHSTAQPLQHLGLGEVGQTLVVHSQLAD